MIELMRFWFFSGCLLAGAAWSIDTLLRGKGVQLRGIWASAMGLTLLSPVLPRLGALQWGQPDANPAPVVLGNLMPMDQPLPTAFVDSLLSNAWVGGAWAAVTAALLLAGATILLRLRRRSQTWRRARVSGEEVLFAPDFGPAVIGLRQPRVVLPEALHNATSDDLELILRHEREHVEARDPWLLMIGAVLVACMPWNLPLVWQGTRMRAAVEEDCDLRVLRSGASRKGYADLLVRMASRPSGFGFAAAAMSERRSGLRRRLERLRNRQGQTRTAVTALLVIAGAGAIGVWMGLPSPVGNWGLFQLHRSGQPVLPAVAPIAPLAPVAPIAPIPPVAPLAEPAPARLLEEQRERLERVQKRLEQSRLQLEELREERPGMTQAELLRLQASRLTLAAEMRHREVEIQEMLAQQRVEIKVDPRVLIRRSEEHSDSDLQPIIYLDGERFFGEVADLDPDQIDRIEVIKGAAARSVHGEDGHGGVINIFLKEKGTRGGSGNN